MLAILNKCLPAKGEKPKILSRQFSIFWSISSFNSLSLLMFDYIGRFGGALDLSEGTLPNVGVLATDPGK